MTKGSVDVVGRNKNDYSVNDIFYDLLGLVAVIVKIEYDINTKDMWSKKFIIQHVKELVSDQEHPPHNQPRYRYFIVHTSLFSL